MGLAGGWQSGRMPAADEELLDALTGELAAVRDVGRSALGVEQRLEELSGLRTLPVVVQATREPKTPLAEAEAIVDVVWRAADRLNADVSEPRLARMLLGLDPDTRHLAPPLARRRAQEASGVQMRQFRQRQERGLLRLVAQQILELQQEEDRLAGARAMMVGADVPQSVALYWLTLFRDHYFRLETSAYALQFDVTTALQKRRDNMTDWPKFAATALYWNVEFSYLRDRFFRLHGPLWFTPTDEGGEALSDAAEAIEYHDAFPEEYVSVLRLLYGRLEQPEVSLFMQALDDSGQAEFAHQKFADWLALCDCDLAQPNERCEVHLLLTNCDRLGQTVEREFSLIQGWYRTERYAADSRIQEFILNFRRSRTEQRDGS